MPPFLRNEPPQTAARQKWAAKIRVGPDTSDILGFSQSIVDSLIAAGSVVNRKQFSALVDSTLQEIGAVERLEVAQSKGVLERFGFGPNPEQPFQVVPLQVSSSLQLTKVILKKFSKAETIFNFYPQNLLFQQLPFVIHLRDIGNANANADGSGVIDHYMFGCWFTDSTVIYDVNDKDDTRLIQSAKVKVGRILTLDDSFGGSPGAQLTRDIFGGILTVADVESLVDDLDLT